MKNENVIEQKTLIQAIQQSYRLEINQIKFMLRGFGGDCFRIETSEKESFFLKLFDPVAHQNSVASSLEFYLPLMDQLHAKGILPNIPHPLLTSEGAFSLKVDGSNLVITNFIEGELVGFGELPTKILAKLAAQVGTLHDCRAQLEFQQPLIDQFEIAFEHDLPQSFENLKALNNTATPGQILLRDATLPRQDEIITALQELKQLQANARNSSKPKVICHTDLHGGNLMTDTAGDLYILDWENALIAPPEHDLIFFAGESDFWEVFWPNYQSQFPAAEIDPQILRFYFYRRRLEDIVDFILRILREDGGLERDQQDVKWMLDCINDLDQLDGIITKIEERLEKH